MTFTQILTVQAGSEQDVAELIRGWHEDQAGAAPGYQGARVLADRGNGGHYLIEVDFTDADSAAKNNDRAETKAWAERLQAVSSGAPEYHDYDVVFSTR